jgi:hypothetical protein
MWVYCKGVKDPVQIRVQGPPQVAVVNGIKASYPSFGLSNGETRAMPELRPAILCERCKKPIPQTEPAIWTFEATVQQIETKMPPPHKSVTHKACPSLPEASIAPVIPTVAAAPAPVGPVLSVQADTETTKSFEPPPATTPTSTPTPTAAPAPQGDKVVKDGAFDGIVDL